MGRNGIGGNGSEAWTSLKVYFQRFSEWFTGQPPLKKLLILLVLLLAAALPPRLMGLTFKTIAASLTTGLIIYGACYLVAWLRYSVYRNKARREFEALTPLLKGERRKEFMPKLVALTRIKLPFKPDWFALRPLIKSAFFPVEQNIHTEYTQEIMAKAAQLLKSHQEWRAAVLNGLVLRGVSLAGLNLSEAFLVGVDFTGSDLSGVNFQGADLSKAGLEGAVLKGADCSRLKLGWHTIVDDNCRDQKALLHYAKVLGRARTLFQAILPGRIQTLLEYKRPDLFYDPGPAAGPGLLGKRGGPAC